MKQHISPKQLNELSEKGKNRLDVWYHDECSHRDLEVETELPRHPLPLLSIGQMIEFLEDHKDFNSSSYIDSSGYDFCFATYDEYSEEKNMVDIGFRGELCDALWEAVKEVLEK